MDRPIRGAGQGNTWQASTTGWDNEEEWAEEWPAEEEWTEEPSSLPAAASTKRKSRSKILWKAAKRKREELEPAEPPYPQRFPPAPPTDFERYVNQSICPVEFGEVRVCAVE